MRPDNESFSRGFDRGNYGNAYESQDWETWYSENCEPPEGLDPVAWAEGALLGFHSSYEINEIWEHALADTVSELRAKYGED
jgi:hypothetical protein